ncbi:MAG TPA: hypothetical protein VF331_10425 [Polyangiales bacterium]
MRPGPSPLVGYNTNVRHKGKLYHIQTEDSGINHPHVITHLFADGGRIIASRKTGYAEHLAAKDLHAIVKHLMQEQHKAVFIELRDCVYDEDGDATPHVVGSHTPEPATAGAAAAHARPASMPPSAAALQELDIDALERAAEARMAESVASKARPEAPRRGAGRYQQTVAAQPARAHSAHPPVGASIFGGDVQRSKSLDEVILSYLSDDVGERER